MSDINGSGYGDVHDWVKDNQGTQHKVAYYHCKKCKEIFLHQYDLMPDIFEAMKDYRVPEKCS